MLFRWTVELFKKGYSKILGPEDLYDPLKTDNSAALGDRLEALVQHIILCLTRSLRYEAYMPHDFLSTSAA